LIGAPLVSIVMFNNLCW